jgi:hypothetical protein
MGKKKGGNSQPAVDEGTDMESRMERVEGDIEEVRSLIEEMRKEASETSSKLIAMMAKSLGKSLTLEAEGEGSHHGKGHETPKADYPKRERPGNTSGSGMRRLEGEELEEFRQSVKKIELLAFNGNDPAGWITRTEIYFRVQETSEAVKVSLAQICMENGTIHFFNSLLRDDENLEWETLKQALMERYGGAGKGTVFEQLAALQQQGSVDEYIQKFECLAAQVPRMLNGQYSASFTNGLKEEIRVRLRSHQTASQMTRGRLLNTRGPSSKSWQVGTGDGWDVETRVGVSGREQVRKTNP